MNSILKLLDIKPIKYEKIGKVTIITTSDNKYVLKKINNTDIYDYLDSRGFHNYPSTKILDNYEVSEYIEEVDTPYSQKLNDLVETVSILHLKTSYVKDITNEYKTLYEDLLNNVEYLFNYYSDMMTIIESKVYMSPSEYLLARNISKVFIKLNELNNDINEWYHLVEEKKTMRNSLIHNNLKVDHILNKNLISFDKSRKDMPIIDLYKMYKKNNLTNIDSLLEIYEKNYPLEEDEKKLLYILIGLPDIIKKEDKEYLNTINIRNMLNRIKINT